MREPESGYLSLVLHAHLPFVRHPEHEVFLEEDWLFEAIIECYIPLLAVLRKMDSEGTDFRLTMSITPPLCEMLRDDLLQNRFLRHLDNLIELSGKEVRKHEDAKLKKLAELYLKRFRRTRELFENDFSRDLVGGFSALAGTGKLEIIACAATHAFLPLIRNRKALRAQIEMGKRSYQKHFGREPRGIWLPECAYSPGLDAELSAAGLRYFFLDSHGILFGNPRPRYGTFRPVYCPGGAAAFGRDPESSKQVWSAETGYPGDPLYREFYRDLGYDGEFEYLRPHLHPDGIRHDLGIKYHRVTGNVPLSEKDLYSPAPALSRAREHAADFVAKRAAQLKSAREITGRAPLVTAPYDAELFGHWWYEGPEFLAEVLKLSAASDEIVPVTPSEYLRENPTLQQLAPSASSWGDKGYFEVWLNGNNDWIYRHLHCAEDRMCELADKFDSPDNTEERALNQAARELMLAQSSDWAFIMTTGTMDEYARARVNGHVKNFTELYRALTSGTIETSALEKMEESGKIFQEMDYRIYRGE